MGRHGPLLINPGNVIRNNHLDINNGQEWVERLHVRSWDHNCSNVGQNNNNYVKNLHCLDTNVTIVFVYH